MSSIVVGAETPTVLFLDDEEPILFSMQRLLRKEPYRVVVCSDPAKAVELAETFRPRVIVSDFRMEGMNGVEFVRRVRALGLDSVCMILSGYADENTIRAALSQGVLHGFMAKPFEAAAIRAGILSLLEYHATKDPLKLEFCKSG